MLFRSDERFFAFQTKNDARFDHFAELVNSRFEYSEATTNAKFEHFGQLITAQFSHFEQKTNEKFEYFGALMAAQFSHFDETINARFAEIDRRIETLTKAVWAVGSIFGSAFIAIFSILATR